ncbi:unnamed protein product, partial [Urochloa humidicola]
ASPGAASAPRVAAAADYSRDQKGGARVLFPLCCVVRVAAGGNLITS